jgi:hypothetical protein
MDEVTKFRERLKKIGIDLELKGNAPWIYLDKVNGNRIQREDYSANHGYTIAWFPMLHDDEFTLNWHDIKKTFEIIRKYR